VFQLFNSLFVFFFSFVADSEKFHDMDRATEPPPVNALRIDDDGEFPPMTQKLDWIYNIQISLSSSSTHNFPYHSIQFKK